MPSKKTVAHFSNTPLMLVLGLGMATFAFHVQAQDTARLAADPKIATALKDVSAEHVQANIEKLVSFGTRLTLSAQDPASISPGRGIGAAREWIKSEFERYSKDCGGCLEVKTDFFHRSAGGPHSPADADHQCLCGVEGDGSANAKRIVLVTGHYDSRNSDTST